MIRSFLSSAPCFLLILAITSGIACKSSDKVSSSSHADSAAKPQTNIHTSGNVRTGTFVNGTSQDTSSTGTKPK